MNIKITRKQASPIIARAFPEYTGRKVFISFTDKVQFYDTNWSGGTRNQYVLLSVNDKMDVIAPVPWNNPIEGIAMPTSRDVIIVKHSHFCGNDMGITIYAHPSYAPKFIEG